MGWAAGAAAAVLLVVVLVYYAEFGLPPQLQNLPAQDATPPTDLFMGGPVPTATPELAVTLTPPRVASATPTARTSRAIATPTPRPLTLNPQPVATPWRSSQAGTTADRRIRRNRCAASCGGCHRRHLSWAGLVE